MRSSSSIVFLVPGFPKDEEDNTCIPALQLYAKNFNSINPSLRIIVIAFQYPYKRKEYFWNGIRIYSAGGKGKGNFIRLFTWILVIKYFFKIKKKYDIRGIHSFWLTECAFIGQLLSKIYHLPHIATLMGQDAKSSNKYLKFLYFKKMVVTSGSSFASNILKNSISYNQTIVIPFGIEKSNGFLDNSRRDIDIIGVGSLIPLKNYNLFVNVVEDLVKEFPSLRIMLVGDGELKTVIENSIIEKKLSTNIRLSGLLNRNEVLHLMKRSRIFLHTSLYESQGLVFLEALYCGLSVVCFDVGFLPHSKKIYKCEDKNRMVNILKQLLIQKNNFDSEYPVTIQDTAKKFNEIYSRIGIVC